MPQDASPHETGRIGQYRLLQRLGEGGMGVVHLAVDPAGRAVAVKVLRPHVASDPDARRRLAREFDTLRRVHHPRVAAVIDGDTEGEVPYLVTSFVPGKPLDTHIHDHGPLPRGHVARVGAVLADALRTIHAAGVVHRDLKPANVMLLDGEPVLIDFGIAHVADESRITHTGLVMGTPGYLSPEIIGGEPVTAATDWWGWGATLAFAATGRPPFGTGPIEVVLDRVRRGASDIEGVDAGLKAILTAALSVDPRRRPRPDRLVAGLAATAPVRSRANSQPINQPPVVSSSTPALPGVEEPVPLDAITKRVPPAAAAAARAAAARAAAQQRVPPVAVPALNAPPLSAPPLSAPPSKARQPAAPQVIDLSADDIVTERVPPPANQVATSVVPSFQEAVTSVVPSPNDAVTTVVPPSPAPASSAPPAWAAAARTPVPAAPGLPATQRFDAPAGAQPTYGTPNAYAPRPAGPPPNAYAQPYADPAYGTPNPAQPQRQGPANGFGGSAAGPIGSYPSPPPVPPAGRPQPSPAPWEQVNRPVADQQAEAEPKNPGDPSRGVLLGILVTLAAVAAIAPYGATWIAALGMVAARVIDRSSTSLLVRRDQRGRRSSDPVMTALALPWRVVVSGFSTVLWIILPILIGISVSFIAASVSAGAPGRALPGRPAPLAIGMIALLLTAWWGPGGGPVRRGTGKAVTYICRGRRAQLIVWGVLLLIVISAVTVNRQGLDPDWGPLKGSTVVQQMVG